MGLGIFDLVGLPRPPSKHRRPCERLRWLRRLSGWKRRDRLGPFEAKQRIMKAAWRSWVGRIAIISLGVTLAALVVWSIGRPGVGPWSARNTARNESSGQPVARDAHFVGRAACVACHQTQHEQFLQSHHHHALAVATPETVRGDFNNQTLSHDDLTSHFFQRDGKFMVRTEGPRGGLAEFEVRFVLAYHPLQQYMVQVVNDLPPASPSSSSTTTATTPADLIDPVAGEGLPALQVLRLCWDVDQGRWFYLRPEDVPEKLQPQDPLHWTGVTQRWNTACAACHSTDLHKNFDHQLAGFRTTFSDIEVACEACHGPGSRHVELMQSPWTTWWTGQGTGLASLKTATAAEQVEVCASCHSRRRLLHEDFHQTGELADHVVYEPMLAETYFVDGQIKDEVFELGSYLQSKMYSKGIRCTDCHDPHTAKTYYPDNRLCTSCHQHPAGVYDSPQHHGHVAGGPGSRCVDCHMPTRHYMDVDPRRDHSIRVPRPDLSVTLGVPNACTGCHADAKRLPSELVDQVPRYQDWQRLAEQGQPEVIAELQRVDRWAADLVDTWRQRQGKPAYPPHFAEHLHPIWQATRGAAPPPGPTERQALLKWATDRAASPMYRVTAWAEISQWLDADSLQAALTALSDADPFVVNQALQRIEQEILRLLEYTSYGWPTPQCQSEVQRLSGPVVELLSHDTRLVRIRAAAILLQLPPAWRSELLGPQQRRWQQALDEALAVHLLNEEMASVANIYESLGQPDRAEEYYRLALQHSPSVYGIRSNLATLLEQKPGGDSQATQDLVTRLRGQDQQLLETELARAGHLPAAGPLHYRYAMTQYLLGNLELVEKHLLEALARRPQEPLFLLAAATYFQAAGNRPAAAQHVATLRQQDPRHPGYVALEREILSNNTP